MEPGPSPEGAWQAQGPQGSEPQLTAGLWVTGVPSTGDAYRASGLLPVGCTLPWPQCPNAKCRMPQGRQNLALAGTQNSRKQGPAACSLQSPWLLRPTRKAQVCRSRRGSPLAEGLRRHFLQEAFPESLPCPAPPFSLGVVSSLGSPAHPPKGCLLGSRDCPGHLSSQYSARSWAQGPGDSCGMNSGDQRMKTESGTKARVASVWSLWSGHLCFPALEGFVPASDPRGQASSLGQPAAEQSCFSNTRNHATLSS